MSSLGETDVTIEAHKCGVIRLRHVYAEDALYPSLGLEISVALVDQTKPFHGSVEALGMLELRGLEGQLRLAEQGAIVGRVRWSGPHHSVRSNHFGGEAHIRLSCELDPARLEAIEERRVGKPLRLWLDLWPTIVAGSKLLDPNLHAIRAEVPRDQWLSFLEKVRSVSYDVIEIPMPAETEETLRRALELARESRRKVDAGDYAGAMIACRKTIEALSVQMTGSTDSLTPFFKTFAHEGTAALYHDIVIRLKKLISKVPHEPRTADSGPPVEFSRGEALFVVRVTESLIGLVASLQQRGPRRSQGDADTNT